MGHDGFPNLISPKAMMVMVMIMMMMIMMMVILYNWAGIDFCNGLGIRLFLVEV